MDFCKNRIEAVQIWKLMKGISFSNRIIIVPGQAGRLPHRFHHSIHVQQRCAENEIFQELNNYEYQGNF